MHACLLLLLQGTHAAREKCGELCGHVSRVLICWRTCGYLLVRSQSLHFLPCVGSSPLYTIPFESSVGLPVLHKQHFTLISSYEDNMKVFHMRIVLSVLFFFFSFLKDQITFLFDYLFARESLESYSFARWDQRSMPQVLPDKKYLRSSK